MNNQHQLASEHKTVVKPAIPKASKYFEAIEEKFDVLSYIAEKQLNITVEQLATKQRFVTNIRSIDMQQQTIELDIPPMGMANLMLLPEDRFQCEIDHPLALIRFYATNIRFNGQTVSLTAPWPDFIAAERIRSYPRINIGRRSHTIARFQLESEELECKIYDVSRNGMSLIADTKDLEQLYGRTLRNVDLYLLGDYPLRVDLEICNRHSRLGFRNSKIRLGCRITAVAKEDKARWVEFRDKYLPAKRTLPFLNANSKPKAIAVDVTEPKQVQTQGIMKRLLGLTTMFQLQSA